MNTARKTLLAWTLILSFISPAAHAFDLAATLAPHLEPHREKLRPLIAKYLGEDLAQKVFPNAKDDVQLPTLPKVESDATSTKVYDKKEQEEQGTQLAPEEETKYNYAFLHELFKSVRGSDPSEDEVSQWMNVLSQGGTREGVYRAVSLDATYAGLENYEMRPSDRSVEFALWLLERFVGQTVKEDTIRKFSFYSLKRICAEKSLEILDAYEGKEDRASWYAVLSGELATKYASVFKEGLRTDSNKLRHKGWALSVPAQHVKGELVIKVHAIFNALK